MLLKLINGSTGVQKDTAMMNILGSIDSLVVNTESQLDVDEDIGELILLNNDYTRS
jgi:hypothetical protein